MLEHLQQAPHVAYFSMEVALDPTIPTYSGGLGVLAGDMMRSAADLGVPCVGVTMVSRRGYVRQEIVDGAQVDRPQPWDPASAATPLPVKVSVTIEERKVWVGAWCWMVETQCPSGRAVPVLLLDTDLPDNHPEDRRLTDELYGGDEVLRVKQEIVLGIGGVRLLHALGAKILKYHMNEGHAAFLALELLADEAQAPGDVQTIEARVEAVRRLCVFTTHTPIPAGQDRFSHALVQQCLGESADPTLLRRFAGEQEVNMTLLAMNLSGWVNGVALKHAEVSRAMFPGYVVHAITNGVHVWTWASDAHRALFDANIPHWANEPELLVHAASLPDAALQAAHAQAKAALIDFARSTGVAGAGQLAPGRLTLGFARRMTGYKRPHLLFQNLERLRAINRRYPLQIVMAGKAHPRDFEGKREIERIHAWATELQDELPVVFLPGYDMTVARFMVGGCDVWVNTPQPPLEASGTSGMKAALNGIPSLSILDGWWLEGWTEGVTGWAVGAQDSSSDAEDAQSLYDKLEFAVAPLFHGDRAGWTAVMRNAIARNGALFHSHRMLRRYMLEAYTRVEE